MPRKPKSHSQSSHVQPVAPEGMIKVSHYHSEGDTTYKKIEYDKDGWADATRYLPVDYDLCSLKVLGRRRVVHGWVCGWRWYGLRLSGDERVLFWRKCKDQ